MNSSFTSGESSTTRNSNHQLSNSTSTNPSSPNLQNQNLQNQNQNHTTADISHHIYNCYLNSEFSDVKLQASTGSGSIVELHLHAVIISQSPFLQNLLRYEFNPPNPLTLTLPPFISNSAFSFAIASLYKPLSFQHLSLVDSLSVLCLAYYLDLSWLGKEAMSVISEGILNQSALEDSIKILSLVDWLDFLAGSVDNLGAFEVGSIGYDSFGKGSTELVNGQDKKMNGQKIQEESSRTTYIGYAKRLKYELNEKLMKLPAELNVTSKDSGFSKTGAGSEGYNKFFEICVKLPFDSVKNVLESKYFPLKEDMDRFSYAKKVIAQRKRALASSTSEIEYEEAVVLQFGGKTNVNTTVSVIRKKQGAKLWKVNQ